MHIRAIHNRQNVKLVGAHPFECQVKALIGVDVWKIECIYNCSQLLIGILRQLTFQPEAVDNPDYATAIHHEKASKFTRLGLLPCFPNREFRWQRLGQSPDHPDYLTLTMSKARLRVREVYTILDCQCFVDRL